MKKRQSPVTKYIISHPILLLGSAPCPENSFLILNYMNVNKLFIKI